MAILGNRLCECAESNKLLPEVEFGFRRNRRTTDCIFILNTLIEKARVDKCSLFVCFVDFCKAFDSVHHGALWRKLVSIGVSQRALTILQSMYFKASSRVRLSRHEATDEFPCQKGVRQCCSLSPLLFSLFLSGLEKQNCRTMMQEFT